MTVIASIQRMAHRMASLDWVIPTAVRALVGLVFVSSGWLTLSVTDALAMGWLMLVCGGLLWLGCLTRLAALALGVALLLTQIVPHSGAGWFGQVPAVQDNYLAVWAGWGIDAAQHSRERSVGVAQRLEKANSILRSQSNHRWITEYGELSVNADGIERPVLYGLLLLVLVLHGGGRFTSLDYWCVRRMAVLRARQPLKEGIGEKQ